MAEDPGKKKLGTRHSGSKGVILTDKKGNRRVHLKEDFAGITQATLKESAHRAAGSGDKSFDAAPAPRVGGTIQTGNSVASGTSNKKTVKRSILKTKKIASAGSPQAKRSVLRSYKRM